MDPIYSISRSFVQWRLSLLLEWRKRRIFGLRNLVERKIMQFFFIQGCDKAAMYKRNIAVDGLFVKRKMENFELKS